jgi:hypothetical protein
MLAAQTPKRKPHRGKATPIEAPAEPTKAPSLNDLAKEALRLNDNDVRSASNHLYEQLSHNPALLRALVDHMVRLVAGASVTSAIIYQRSQAFSGSAGAARNKANAKIFAGVVASALLEVPMSNGTLLKNATLDEINETADRWEAQALTMSHRSRWLRAIAEKLPPGKRCGDVLTEKQAKALFDKTALK